MANEEHLAIARRGAAAWNEWRSKIADLNPVVVPFTADDDEAYLTLLEISVGETFERVPHKTPPLQRADLTNADLQEADLSRADLSHADLMGANLSRANLSNADLSAANLSHANLHRANFWGAKLIGTNLSNASVNSANLANAKLNFAHLTGADLCFANLCNASLVGCALTKANLKSANLSDADMSHAKLAVASLCLANLNGTNLTRADLRRANLACADVSGANLSCANLMEAELTGIRWNPKRMGRNYRGVRGIESIYGNSLFRRAAADQDFLDTLEEAWRGTWRASLYRLWGLLDYGRSMSRVAGFGFGVATLYGVIYRSFPDILNYTDTANTWFTPFYFSIVTFTTLGFGDVRPKSLIGELLASSEVIIGYITLGLLLAVLAEKLARRS